MKKLQSILILLLTLSFAVSSCLKEDYEAPPDLSQVDPNLPVNMTIAELKTLHTNTTAPRKIDSAWRIAGVVVADDRSGNFYKQITIEDSTGGITILINRNSLYTRYPIGRKIYVDLQGLYFGYYAKYPQLGMLDPAGAMSEIPPTVVDSFITGATYPHVITPDTVDLDYVSALNPALLNRLITIREVEFEEGELGSTYAQDPNTASQSGTDRFIHACSGSGKLSVRTSNYASFRSVVVPGGKGTVTGIYTVYNNTPQLVIRDTSDVQLKGLRCDGTNPGSIIFKETFNGVANGDITLPGWTNFTQAGTQKWRHSNSGSTSNPYARISAFGSGENSVISWLITPEMNLSNVPDAVLTFRSLAGFHNGATLEVLYSTDFSGDPTSATWTKLNPTISQNTGPFAGASWESSGLVSLPTAGKVHVAFKYVGSDPSATTTYEIDDVTVSGQ